MNKENYMTGRKMKVYLVKYWWVIALFLGLSIIGLFLGINRNINKEVSTITIYEQIFSPTIVDEEKANSLSLVSGNSTVLLNIPEVQEEINLELKNKEKAEIKNWDLVNLTTIENSSFVKLTINEEQDVEYQIETIIENINEKLLEYDQNIKLVSISEIKKNILEKEQFKGIYLKDIVSFCMIIFVGIIIVYLLALFGNKVADIDEVQQIMGGKPGLCIEKRKDNLFDEWLQSINQDVETIFLIDDGAEFVEKAIKENGNENFQVYSLADYKGTNVKRYLGKNKYVFIQEMKTNLTEIEKINKINEMYGERLAGWVYIKYDRTVCR